MITTQPGFLYTHSVSKLFSIRSMVLPRVGRKPVHCKRSGVWETLIKVMCSVVKSQRHLRFHRKEKVGINPRTQQPIWALKEKSLGAKLGRSNTIRKVVRYERKKNWCILETLSSFLSLNCKVREVRCCLVLFCFKKEYVEQVKIICFFIRFAMHKTTGWSNFKIRESTSPVIWVQKEILV